jgi:DNA repair exonuclease SbcCD nuclease subunit
MKIAILSDFHLGYERFREDAYRQAEEALNRAASVADAIIIPGDIFDNRTPKPDVLAEGINIFRNLSKKKWGAQVVDFKGEGQCYTNVPIIAIPGTHERRAQDATDPVDLLGMTGLIVDVSNATAVIEKDGERVAIVGIGGIADERFRDIVNEVDPKPVEGAFSIFMFHESVYELLPFNDNFIKQDELPKGFDLYVCGHIHSRFESEVHGKKFLIPGSTVLTQLKPGEQERKGFYVYDTASGSYSFEHIGSRRFVVVKIDAPSMEQAGIADLVEGEIDRAIGGGKDVPVIRVMVEGAHNQDPNAEIELNGIPKRYQGRAIVEVSKSGINDDSIRTANSEFSTAMFENMSVKDYGIGIFVQKLKDKKVSFGKISPVDLFDMLSAEGAKDKVVNSTMNSLLEE